MKFLTLLMAIAVAAGCPHYQPQKRASKKHTSSATNTPAKRGVGGVLESNETGILVNSAWMKRYREMESKHGSIPEDDLIWKEGENYRVNDAVINHFSEMKIAENAERVPAKKQEN